MSLQIYKSPPSIVFSGNPIVFGVKQNNALSSNTENRATVGIIFNTPIINGIAYIRIIYNGNSYKLDFGSDIPFIGSYGMLEWIQVIADKMKGNRTLNNLFFISYNYNQIYLVEREILDDISIKKGYISSQISITNYISSQSITQKSYYIRVIPTKVKIYKYPVSFNVYDFFGTGVEIETMPTVVSDDDISGRTGDFSVYIENSVSDLLYEKKTGHFDLESEYTVYDLATKFAMLFENATTNESLYSEIFHVIDAKISKVIQADINEMEISLWQYIQNQKMFLTWSPDNKKIDIYHPEILNFIVPTDGTYNIVVKEYFANEDTAENTINSFEATQYQVTLISAAFLNIRSENPPAALVKFEISITNSSNENVISKRTYYMDYSYFASPRWWLFKNSFGVYEVIRTTGKAVKEIDIEKTFIEKDLPDLYTHIDRDIEQTGSEKNYVMELYSGPLNEAEAKHFNEFLESEDVYLINQGKALPVIIYDGSFEIKSDGSNLTNIKFKVEGNNLDTEHVNLNIELPVPGDFNGDFNEGFLI